MNLCMCLNACGRSRSWHSTVLLRCERKQATKQENPVCITTNISFLKRSSVTDGNTSSMFTHHHCTINNGILREVLSFFQRCIWGLEYLDHSRWDHYVVSKLLALVTQRRAAYHKNHGFGEVLTTRPRMLGLLHYRSWQAWERTEMHTEVWGEDLKEESCFKYDADYSI